MNNTKELDATGPVGSCFIMQLHLSGKSAEQIYDQIHELNLSCSLASIISVIEIIQKDPVLEANAKKAFREFAKKMAIAKKKRLEDKKKLTPKKDDPGNIG
jgi:hypothetical protein